MRGLWRSWRRRFPNRDVGINLYYSPPGTPEDEPTNQPSSSSNSTTTLSQHADIMDEFIIQLGGKKRWNIEMSSNSSSSVLLDNLMQEFNPGNAGSNSSTEGSAPVVAAVVHQRPPTPPKGFSSKQPLTDLSSARNGPDFSVTEVSGPNLDWLLSHSAITSLEGKIREDDNERFGQFDLLAGDGGASA